MTRRKVFTVMLKSCVCTTLNCLRSQRWLPWLAALSGNPYAGLVTGGGTGGGGKFLSLIDSFGKVTYEDVFGCVSDQKENKSGGRRKQWIYSQNRTTRGYRWQTFSGIGGGWPSESLLFSLFPGSFSVSPSSSVPADKETKRNACPLTLLFVYTLVRWRAHLKPLCKS